MRIDRHWLGKAKSFLIEITALVCLVMVLVKIILVEFQHLFK